MFPQALRLDDQAGVATLVLRAHRFDGRAEVGHVQLAAQVGRQRGALEFDDQVLALLAHVHTGTVVGQVDDHTAFTVLATAEVDVLQRVDAAAGILGHHRQRTGFDRGADHGVLAVERQDQVVAVDLGLKAHGARHVQHDARTLAALHHVDAFHVTAGNLDQAATDAVVGVLEVERQPVRVGQAEAGRYLGQRHAHADAHLRGFTLLRADDRFDGITDGPGRAGSNGAEPDKGCGDGGFQKAHGRMFPRSLVHDLGSSSRESVVSCSTQSPAASRTSSFTPISVSVILVMRP